MNGTLASTFLSLILIVGILSYLAYNSPLDTFDSWLKPMLIILCGLIFVQLIDLLFFVKGAQANSFIQRYRIYSWIGLLLFSGFLVYDTQHLIKKAHYITSVCSSKNQSICADYPKESLNIFLDIYSDYDDYDLMIAHIPFCLRYEFFKKAFESNKPFIFLCKMECIAQLQMSNLFYQYGVIIKAIKTYKI